MFTSCSSPQSALQSPDGGVQLRRAREGPNACASYPTFLIGWSSDPLREGFVGRWKIDHPPCKDPLVTNKGAILRPRNHKLATMGTGLANRGVILVLWLVFVLAAAGRVVDRHQMSAEASQKWSFNVWSSSDELNICNWRLKWGYSGISTFGHLPHLTCLTEFEESFDIAIVGAPFDTAVSYRPGTHQSIRLLEILCSLIPVNDD
jgi:hypothetical protein